MLQSNDTRDTLLLHKARTKARALSMPVHSWRHVINNKTLHLSAVMHANTGGRTVQALPKETQVTGQMRRQKNYNYREYQCSLYTLHWVGETGRKAHKTIPTFRGHAHRTYNMKVVTQIVQQSTKPRITYSRGDDTRDTLQLHKACTKARASSMPVHKGVMKSRIDHLSALTHGIEATAHKTHYDSTRHVPRGVPCPFTTGII